MMKSVDFETRKCSRDGGTASPTSLVVEMITYLQYLNCKILRGERFCSLDQTRLACASTLVEIMYLRHRH